jgi:hypothetical protein
MLGMRNLIAALAVGTLLASAGCATVPGEKSSFETHAEEAAKDLLRIGRALAEQGARDACETIVRNGIAVLQEKSEYAKLLPSPEAFCGLFFKSDSDSPEAPEAPETFKSPEVRL